MSKKDKLVGRFNALPLPTDFTWDELISLLKVFGFEECQRGKTSGSGVTFYRSGYPPIFVHKPHPQKILKTYQMKYIKDYLKNEELL